MTGARRRRRWLAALLLALPLLAAASSAASTLAPSTIPLGVGPGRPACSHDAGDQH